MFSPTLSQTKELSQGKFFASGRYVLWNVKCRRSSPRSGGLIHHHLWHERNLIKANSGCVLDCIQNCRRWSVHWEFADSFCARWPKGVWVLSKVHSNRREISGCRHNVVCHLTIQHPAILPNHTFIKRVADCLRHATLDLTGGKDGIDHAADLLHRYEIIDVCFISQRIVR